MKKLTSLLVVLSMILSMFAGITVTTAAGATETITIFRQTYEDDCSSVDMKTVFRGYGNIVNETGKSNKVMDITVDPSQTSTVLSCVNPEI